MNLDDFRTLSQGLQGLATVLAIIVGGFWTYLIFVNHRQKYPRASIEQGISFTRIPGTGGLVHVEVSLKNIGDVLLSIVYVRIEIKQVLPPGGQLARTVGNDALGASKGVPIINWDGVAKYEDAPETDSFEI